MSKQAYENRVNDSSEVVSLLVKTLDECYPVETINDPSTLIMVSNFTFDQHLAWLMLNGANDGILTNKDLELLRNTYFRSE